MSRPLHCESHPVSSRISADEKLRWRYNSGFSEFIYAVLGGEFAVRKIHIFALGTVLALTSAIGAKVEAETVTDAEGMAHEVTVPASTSNQGEGAVADQQSVGEPEKQAAPASNVPSTSRDNASEFDRLPAAPEPCF